MNTVIQPRLTKVFRFVRCSYADGVAELVYAFDEGEELIERIRFPLAPTLPAERAAAFNAALKLLHLIAGVSYYKAGVPPTLEVVDGPLDVATADLLDALYLHGLAEFAYRNGLDLRERIAFPRLGAERSARSRVDASGSSRSHAGPAAVADALNLPRRTLVPIGGGKDSLVAIEAIKSIGGAATAVWVGNSPLIAACAERTGLPMLNIGRELAPGLFELNRLGAWNGHIPVTAVNSAILVVAALLYGFDSIAFANERSASAATLEYAGQQVNHQWSKGYAFWPSPVRLRGWRHTSRCFPVAIAISNCADPSRRIVGVDNARNAILCFSRWRRSCPSLVCCKSLAATCWTTSSRHQASTHCWNITSTNRLSVSAKLPRRGRRCLR